MIVNWKKEKAGILYIPLADGSGKDLMFLQGHNEVSEEDWETVKEHKSVQKHIERGDLIEVIEEEQIEKPVRMRKGKETEEKSYKVKKQIKDFPEMSAKKAREIVQDTYDIETLERWLGKEGRDEIRALIHNQIELIKNPKLESK